MPIPQRPRAVVTGGAGGLGRAFCVALAKRGAQIVIADRDLAGAEETAHRVANEGGQAHATVCDVSKPDQVAALANVADERFGGVDVVVNNAGVAVAGAIGEVPLSDWEWIVSINLWGVLYGCHTFAPRLKRQGSGHILNVASAAGLLCAPEMGPYNVTKAGVVALSETLYSELKEHHVGVTVLCPTFFRTNIGSSGRMHQVPDGQVALMNRLMDQSKLQADGIAAVALEACDKDELYVVPQPDGQWAWRLKRLAPERYYGSWMPRVMQMLRKAETKRQKKQARPEPKPQT